MKRVFQQNINKPTEELYGAGAEGHDGATRNHALIDNYRRGKRQMAEAEAVRPWTHSSRTRWQRGLPELADLRTEEGRATQEEAHACRRPERVKLYIAQLKQSLPAVIPTVTHFDESTDRWGRKGRWRVQQYGHLSGLAVLDADHVPNPEERINEWLRRDDFRQLGIVWIFITPLGEGIKVVFKAREEWGNLQDNAYQMAETLGVLDYADGQTKNSDHAHFIPKASDVKYIDWEQLFGYENPAYEERYGEAYRRGESEPTKPRWQELEQQRKKARRQPQSTVMQPGCRTAHRQPALSCHPSQSASRPSARCSTGTMATRLPKVTATRHSSARRLPGCCCSPTTTPRRRWPWPASSAT